MTLKGKILRALFLALIPLSLSLPTAAEDDSLAGLAIHIDTARDIYIAGLYTGDGATGPDLASLAPPVTLEYRLAIRRLSARGFFGTLLLQAELGAGARAPDAVVDSLARMRNAMQGFLVQGDSFTARLNVDGSTVYSLDGTELLSAADAATFEFLAQGWLGDNASTLLRDPLLAGDIDPALRERYEALQPPAGREAEVAGWAAPSAAPATTAVAAAKPVEKKSAPQPPAEKAKPKAAPPAASDSAVTAAAKAPDVPAQKADVAAPAPAKAEAEPVEQVAVAVAETQDTPNAPEQEEAAPAPVAQAPEPTAAKENAVAQAQARDTKASAPEVDDTPAASPAVADAQPAESPAAETAATAAQTVATADAASGAVDDREYQLSLQRYMRQTLGSVFRELQYPSRARQRGLQGQVEVLAKVRASGELLEVQIGTSSTIRALDSAAVRAVEKAAPFPALDAVAREEFGGEPGDAYLIPIPVTFRLN
ncbi:energy transducer TonB family protein [Mangrovimicrobium sediminis]|nr:TonB family protein [Haliea sp. SAOS-164]